jgi:hypothetical protein
MKEFKVPVGIGTHSGEGQVVAKVCTFAFIRSVRTLTLRKLYLNVFRKQTYGELIIITQIENIFPIKLAKHYPFH